MPKQTKQDYSKDYTNPKLREALKDQIKADNKGGKPGQWSARKAQRLAQAYKKQGGGHKHTDQYTASQQHLHDWTAKHKKD